MVGATAGLGCNTTPGGGRCGQRHPPMQALLPHSRLVPAWVGWADAEPQAQPHPHAGASPPGQVCKPPWAPQAPQQCSEAGPPPTKTTLPSGEAPRPTQPALLPAGLLQPARQPAALQRGGPAHCCGPPPLLSSRAASPRLAGPSDRVLAGGVCVAGGCEDGQQALVALRTRPWHSGMQRAGSGQQPEGNAGCWPTQVGPTPTMTCTWA